MKIHEMQYEERFEKDGGHTYTFKGNCQYCKQTVSVTVKGEELYQFNKGKLIQESFPNLSVGDREFLISGICDNCWKNLFG